MKMSFNNKSKISIFRNQRWMDFLPAHHTQENIKGSLSGRRKMIPDYTPRDSRKNREQNEYTISKNVEDL